MFFLCFFLLWILFNSFMFSFPLCHLLVSNKLPKNLVAYNNTLISQFLWVRFWAQLSKVTLAQRLSQTATSALVISEIDLGKIIFQARSCGCWQDSGLCWLLAWGPQSLAERNPQRLPSVPCHLGLPTGQLASSKCVIWDGNREYTHKTEVTVVYNLTTWVTSNHFCWIPFIRSKSVSPAHTQGWIQGCETRG